MGSIVWVRRRNGSWWPGKVLGPDELTHAHLMSPRSGTPVKLLGREDASVDWYNLEKSKRVKAFRCGEFDECIEKAEASLGLPAKKREREKYARRDDAILHALRLEKEFREKQNEDLGVNSISMKDSSSNYVVADLATSGTFENGRSEHRSHGLWPLHRETGLSVGKGSSRFAPCSRKVKSVDQQASLYSEVKPQMRDLQVLGMKTVQPKPMATSSAALNYSQEMMVDDKGYASKSSSGADSGNTSGRVKELMYGRWGLNQEHRTSTNLHTDYSQGIGNYVQVKRSRASYMPSELNDYVGVKGSSSGQIDIFGSHNCFTNKLPSASSEDTESDSSETDSEERAMDAEMKTNSGTFTPMDSQSRSLSQLDLQGDESLSSEDEDSISPGYSPHIQNHNSISMDRKTRRKLKRKRHVRSSPRKPVDRLTSTSYPNVGGRRLWRSSKDGMSYYHDNSVDAEFLDDDVQVPIGREHGNHTGYIPQSAIRSNEVPLGDDMETWMRRNRFSGYNGDFRSFFARVRNRRNMLLDVDLQVEAQHQRDAHVPWISMTSGLNGNSIVGLPIRVEKLGDGSTDFLLSTLNGFGNNIEIDNYRSRMSEWHVAVRTGNVQIPPSGIFSSSHPGEDDNLLYCDQDQRIQFGRIAVAGLPAQRNDSHAHKLSDRNRNKNKKVAKKSSLCSSSPKMRPLTSIGIGPSRVTDDDDDDDYMDLGSIGPPTVACIPLKLVFSRLLEAVGKSASSGLSGRLPRCSDEQQQQ